MLYLLLSLVYVSPSKQSLHDWHLMLVTLALTAFAVLLVVLESAIPDLRGEVHLVTDDEHPTGETVSVSLCMWRFF